MNYHVCLFCSLALLHAHLPMNFGPYFRYDYDWQNVFYAMLCELKNSLDFYVRILSIVYFAGSAGTAAAQ